jgi:DNA-binding LacI/PurR family transcriptional regulator
MRPSRIARFVNRSAADAWIVCAGSREVLAWFAEESIPVFALFGRRSGLPIAGGSPRKIPAMQQAVDELVGLGHRRIVMLSREERCQPEPALYEAEFLKRLETNGIDASSYHLPHWSNDADSFHRCLDTLFGLTPPTALFVNEPMLFISAMLHLTRKGLRCPEDVSMVCDDPSREFLWCRPSVTHIAWDAAPLIRRVLQWAGHVAQGTKDTRQSNTQAKLVRGDSIGPAPQRVRGIQGSDAESPEQRD